MAKAVNEDTIRWLSMIAAVLLAVMSLALTFQMASGLFPLLQGTTIILMIVGLIVLLIIEVRLEELLSKKMRR